MSFFCSENGELYLAVKVVDQEVKHTLDRVGCLLVKALVDQGDLVQVSTDGVLVAPVTTLEGEHIPLHPVPINFGISGGDCSEVLFVSVSPRFLGSRQGQADRKGGGSAPSAMTTSKCENFDPRKGA